MEVADAAAEVVFAGLTAFVTAALVFVLVFVFLDFGFAMFITGAAAAAAALPLVTLLSAVDGQQLLLHVLTFMLTLSMLLRQSQRTARSSKKGKCK